MVCNHVFIINIKLMHHYRVYVQFIFGRCLSIQVLLHFKSYKAVFGCEFQVVYIRIQEF